MASRRTRRLASQLFSSAVRPKLARQRTRPIAAAMARIAIRKGSVTLASPIAPSASSIRLAMPSPIAPPQPATSPLTAPPAKSPAAAPIMAMPRKERVSARPQRPGSTPRASRRPSRKTTGSSSTTGGPISISRKSEVQAPSPPIQLCTGPAACVFSEGSLA